jgi:hypothetical protein
MFTYQNYALSDKGGKDLIMRTLFERLETLEKEVKELREQQPKRHIAPIEHYFRKVKK